MLLSPLQPISPQSSSFSRITRIFLSRLLLLLAVAALCLSVNAPDLLPSPYSHIVRALSTIIIVIALWIGYLAYSSVLNASLERSTNRS